MRFLSLWQPWASLMAIGAKRIETRSWVTNYRGLIGIHAGLNRTALDRCSESAFRDALEDGGIQGPADLPFGAIVAVGRLHECVRTREALVSISQQEEQFGNYGPGRWAWMFEDVRPVAVIYCRGRQGLWTDPELEAKVRAAMEGR